MWRVFPFVPSPNPSPSRVSIPGPVHCTGYCWNIKLIRLKCSIHPSGVAKQMNILILLVYAEFCLLYFLIKEGFAQYSFLAKFGVWSKRMLLCRSVNQRFEGPDLKLGPGGSTFWWLLKVMVIKTVPFIAKVQILSHLDRAFGCFTWDSYFFIPKRDSSPNIFLLIFCLPRTYVWTWDWKVNILCTLFL